MPELRLLTAADIPALLEFELANRAYFTRTISDRGDAYFDHFTERVEALVADQRAGHGAYYLLVDDERLLGRFNLILDDDSGATVGYRMAEAAAGRGLATAALRRLILLATERHGLRVLRAATADSNPASRRVLEKCGFVPDGPAEPGEVGGRAGQWHRLTLTASGGRSRPPTG